jgi:hypothetical protein
LDIRSSLKPFITESTTTSDITPTITLSTEITVITGMNACFRLAFRYLKAKNNSKNIDVLVLLFFIPLNQYPVPDTKYHLN